jgi:hypothetical protein
MWRTSRWMAFPAIFSEACLRRLCRQHGPAARRKPAIGRWPLRQIVVAPQ